MADELFRDRCFDRRFSGDEAFLDDPNAFNNSINGSAVTQSEGGTAETSGVGNDVESKPSRL